MPAPKINGFEQLVAKHSAVDHNGDLLQTPIDGLRFRPTRTVSWDHRKLGGTY